MINRTDYVAAHIRVADAHWDAADCQHKMNGNPISSVSCGDGLNVINYSSIAQEIWYVLRISGDKKQARLEHLEERPTPLFRSPHPPCSLQVYVATNMPCADTRLVRIGLMLARRNVQLICAQELLKEKLGEDNYFVSIVEQELCVRSHAFVGSKYSTWTDTVKGKRSYLKNENNFQFEELWALGIK